MDASIIITAYNYERYVGRAVRSCLHQSFSRDKFEIIVVDDGSTDNTRHVLDSFGQDIKVIRFERNCGLSTARNEGIKVARGRFVTLLDADDYLHHDFLAITMLYMHFNFANVDAVAVDHYLVDENERVTGRISQEKSPQACGILFQKDHLVDIGLYDPKINICEEIDLRLRFLSKFKITSLDMPLYRYRLHGLNLTNANETRIAQSVNYIRDKHALGSEIKPDYPSRRSDRT